MTPVFEALFVEITQADISMVADSKIRMNSFLINMHNTPAVSMITAIIVRLILLIDQVARSSPDSNFRI